MKRLLWVPITMSALALFLGCPEAGAGDGTSETSGTSTGISTSDYTKSDDIPSKVSSEMPDSISSGDGSRAVNDNANAIGYEQLAEAKENMDSAMAMGGMFFLYADVLMQKAEEDSATILDAEGIKTATITLSDTLITAMTSLVPDAPSDLFQSGQNTELYYKYETGTGDYDFKFSFYASASAATPETTLLWNTDFSKVKILASTGSGKVISMYDAATLTSALVYIDTNSGGASCVLMKENTGDAAKQGVWMEFAYHAVADMGGLDSPTVYQSRGYANDDGGYFVTANTAAVVNEKIDSYEIEEIFNSTGICVHSKYTHNDGGVLVPNDPSGDTLPNDDTVVTGAPYDGLKTNYDNWPADIETAKDAVADDIASEDTSAKYGVTFAGAVVGEAYAIFDTEPALASLNNPGAGDYAAQWTAAWNDNLYGVFIPTKAGEGNVYIWDSDVTTDTLYVNPISNVTTIGATGNQITIP